MLNLLEQLGGSALGVIFWLAFFGLALYILDIRYGHLLRAGAEIECCERLEAVETRNSELLAQVHFLVAELKRTGAAQGVLAARVNELMLQQAATAQQVSRANRGDLVKPLLLICADEDQLCNQDRNALRRAGISFQRLRNATKESIERELRRRRQDESLYPWLHITAHAGPGGVDLYDGLAPPTWWSDRLDGFDIVFLAACQGSNVADAIAGLVTVVFLQEDVDNQDAADFTYVFWSNVIAGASAQEAYARGINVVPQISEFVDIRVS